MERGHLHTAAVLLDAGVDPDNGGADAERTPLTAAACLADPLAARRAVRLLRRHGADLTQRDKSGRRPEDVVVDLAHASSAAREGLLADLREAGPAPPPPQRGWLRATDAIVGRDFFFDPATGLTSWEQPEADPALDDPTAWTRAEAGATAGGTVAVG